jgi:hypothetical protein
MQLTLSCRTLALVVALSLPGFASAQTGAASAKGTVQRPSVVDWDEDHPVSRFVTFGALDVTVARKVELRKEAGKWVRGSLVMARKPTAPIGASDSRSSHSL